MKILLAMAWRNLWRNKRRTAILICAMVVGLAGVLALVAWWKVGSNRWWTPVSGRTRAT